MLDIEGVEGVSTQQVKANIYCDYDGNHKVSEVEKKEATCTEDGNEAYYICDNCGTMFADADQKTVIKEVPVIRATGHKFGEWKVTKEPTTTAEGEETRICENCQEKETRSIARLTPKPENSNKNDNSASTGDDSNLLLPLTLMMAAAAAGGITILRRKTNK